MDCNGWHKSMDHLPSMCWSSALNTQVIFYDGHDRQFDDMALIILLSHHIHSLIVKEGYYFHEYPKDNGTILNLKSFYSNTGMNWTIEYGTLQFNPAHTNAIVVEIWEALKLYYWSMTQEALNKTKITPL